MKHRFFLFVMLLLSAAGASAQTSSESVKVSSDQVPAVVKRSYEKEFGTVPDGGDWKVRIVRTMDNGHVKATPLWYSYTRRGKNGKLDVRFSPDGELQSQRGKTGSDTVSGTEESRKAGS